MAKESLSPDNNGKIVEDHLGLLLIEFLEGDEDSLVAEFLGDAALLLRVLLMLKSNVQLEMMHLMEKCDINCSAGEVGSVSITSGSLLHMVQGQ